MFNIFMLYGLKYTTAIEAGIITSTLPAVIGLFSFILLKEKLTVKKGFGIAFAVLGVLCFNLIGNSLDGNNSLKGNLLIFGAVLGETLFIIMGKSLSNKVTPLTISTMMSIFGLIMFLPFAIYEAIGFDFSNVGIGAWINILYFGIVVTVVAFLLMYQGLSRVPANSTGVLTSLIPISSIFLSFFILKEQIYLTHLLGMFLVLIAIIFISKESTINKELEVKPSTVEAGWVLVFIKQGGSMKGYGALLIESISKSDLLTRVFQVLIDLNLPFEYYVGAACITNTIWNDISGYPLEYGISDIV